MTRSCRSCSREGIHPDPRIDHPGTERLCDACAARVYRDLVAETRDRAHALATRAARMGLDLTSPH